VEEKYLLVLMVHFVFSRLFNFFTYKIGGITFGTTLVHVNSIV